ncbi:hypothetical protein [Blautia glucerasea]|uniref:hypothetical protein n=1 Tax=Blautia glucerasea TaxID=536633 RepID=UPI00156F5259|nr:hypothetical protein [Blautia glucerasea]NSJ28764.1 hypothetical protein [Blautia glucerasea]
MKRNKKCNIAGILFTLLLIYEAYSYVMFLKVLSKFGFEMAWRQLYFRSYEDGCEWVMIIGKLFAIESLIIMINSSFRLTKARIGMRKKTAIVYFFAQFSMWLVTFSLNTYHAILNSWSMRTFLYNVWNFGMIYICVIVYLIAYCLYRSGKAKQKEIVPDTCSEEWKISYYKNLLDHKVITQKEYQSMIEKIKIGQLM